MPSNPCPRCERCSSLPASEDFGATHVCCCQLTSSNEASTSTNTAAPRAHPDDNDSSATPGLPNTTSEHLSKHTAHVSRPSAVPTSDVNESPIDDDRPLASPSQNGQGIGSSAGDSQHHSPAPSTADSSHAACNGSAQSANSDHVATLSEAGEALRILRDTRSLDTAAFVEQHKQYQRLAVYQFHLLWIFGFGLTADFDLGECPRRRATQDRLGRSGWPTEVLETNDELMGDQPSDLEDD